MNAQELADIFTRVRWQVAVMQPRPSIDEVLEMVAKELLATIPKVTEWHILYRIVKPTLATCVR